MIIRCTIKIFQCSIYSNYARIIDITIISTKPINRCLLVTARLKQSRYNSSVSDYIYEYLPCVLYPCVHVSKFFVRTVVSASATARI